MKREEAYSLITDKVKNKNLIKHMLATEACMKALAENFNEDKEAWGFAGLLHDYDYDETANDFANHGLVSAKILGEKGIDPEIVHAIKAHPGHVERISKMDKSLYAADPLTGLIVACALMHPTKSLAGLDVKFISNRFKEKRFAAGANRDQISTCIELGIDLEKFIEICLKAMQGVSKELGL